MIKFQAIAPRAHQNWWPLSNCLIDHINSVCIKDKNHSTDNTTRFVPSNFAEFSRVLKNLVSVMF